MSEKLFIDHKFKDMINQVEFLHNFCREGEYFHKAIEENGGNPDYLNHVRSDLRSLLGKIKEAHKNSGV
jgi:hypothetical protein